MMEKTRQDDKEKLLIELKEVTKERDLLRAKINMILSKINDIRMINNIENYKK